MAVIASKARQSRFSARQQGSVAAGCGGVDGEGLLRAEAVQVMRATGFGAGAAEAFAAEGLHANHRAYLVAVDVDVAM